SPITCRSSNLRHRGHDPAAERGGPPAAAPPAPSWPQALRAIRAWLSPSIALQRWWQAWSKAPPPPQLQALMNSVAAGCGLHLNIRNYQTPVRGGALSAKASGWAYALA